MNINRQTLSDQIYQSLRHDILHGSIKAGDRLTLKNLKEQFGVSSTPVREALTRLTEDALVSYETNVGIYVISLNHDDFKEIYELIGDLDSLAIRYSNHSENKEELKSRLKENIEASSDFSIHDDEWLTLSDDFHLLFYQYCGNSRLVSSAEHLRSQLSIAAYQYEKDRTIRAEIHKEHEAIFQAFFSDDIEEACRLMKIHLAHSLGYAIE